MIELPSSGFIITNRRSVHRISICLSTWTSPTSCSATRSENGIRNQSIELLRLDNYSASSCLQMNVRIQCEKLIEVASLSDALITHNAYDVMSLSAL